jgi:hypothetical protein
MKPSSPLNPKEQFIYDLKREILDEGLSEVSSTVHIDDIVNRDGEKQTK